MSSVTILIPARGGSKRVPRKGMQRVGGRTLIRRALDTAREAFAGADARIVVLSDDRDMLAEADGCGVDLPSVYAAEPNGVPEVCAWFANSAKLDDFDIGIVLQPTSPFVNQDDAWRVYKAIVACGAESVVSVTVDGKGYRRNGALYATFAKNWKEGQCIAGPTIFHVMPPKRSLDIDTMEDLKRARRMAGDPEETPSLFEELESRWPEAGASIRESAAKYMKLINPAQPCGVPGCDRQATSMVREKITDERRPRCSRHALPPGRDANWMYVSRLDGR